MATPISPRSFKRFVNISVIRFRWCVDMSFNCCSSDEVEFRSDWKRTTRILMEKTNQHYQFKILHTFPLFWSKFINRKIVKFANFKFFNYNLCNLALVGTWIFSELVFWLSVWMDGEMDESFTFHNTISTGAVIQYQTIGGWQWT
jgi:hypothetical protein